MTILNHKMLIKKVSNVQENVQSGIQNLSLSLWPLSRDKEIIKSTNEIDDLNDLARMVKLSTLYLNAHFPCLF